MTVLCGHFVPATIACNGDSTCIGSEPTYVGWGARLFWRYLPSSIWLNDGIAGATTTTYLASNLAASLAHKATHHIIQFGINDQKDDAGHVTEEQYAINLASFAAQIVANGGVPIFITPHRTNEWDGAVVTEELATYAAAMVAYAAGAGYACFDLYAMMKPLMEAIGQATWDATYAVGSHHFTEAGAVYVCGLISAGLAYSPIGYRIES